MAARVLLPRLTMFLFHLWAAIETTSAAAGTRPQAIGGDHPKPSLRTLSFRRAHSGGLGASGTRRGGASVGTAMVPSSSSGANEEERDAAREPRLPRQWLGEREGAEGNQTSSRPVLDCTHGAEDVIYGASSGAETRKYGDFSTVTDVSGNDSLAEVEESSPGNRGGEASWCSYPQAVPSAWKPFFSDQELVCLVNPHWLQFDPPSHVSHLVFASVYLVVMVVGLVGNGLVVYLFVSSRALRTPSNLFILNLAVSDFFLLSALILYVYNSLHEAPATGKIGCDVYGCIGGLTGTTSIMTLAAISMDRYLVITFPLDPFKRFSHRQVLSIIVITWMYSSVFSFLPLVGIAGISYTPEGFLTSCSFDYLSEAVRTRLYIFSFFVAAWVVPLAIISFSYLSIVSIVSKQERHYSACQGSLAHSFKHQRIRRKKSSEVKLAKVASGIIGLWVVAWTPYAVVALLGIFRQKALITPVVSMIPALFCKTAACLDPYVYALSHPRFKGELNKRLGRCRPTFTGVRNGIPQGYSISTFSEIREERELSEAQGWETTDPSFSSLGPLLQRNPSCSSHPTARTRSRASLSSPGSRSLISPTGEVYPRKSLSTYSFRRASRSFRDKREAVASPAGLLTAATTTTTFVEFPNDGRLPRLPFTNGVEEPNVESPQKDPTTTTTKREENQAPKENPTTHPYKGDHHRSLFVRQGRSKSLPNMSQNRNGESKKALEGRWPRNVLLQLFHGKILHSVRRNRSHSSLYRDE